MKISAVSYNDPSVTLSAGNSTLQLSIFDNEVPLVQIFTLQDGGENSSPALFIVELNSTNNVGKPLDYVVAFDESLARINEDFELDNPGRTTMVVSILPAQKSTTFAGNDFRR